MLYFPDQNIGKGNESWADPTLFCLGYDCRPAIVKMAMREIYRRATARIRMPGVKVVPLSLFAVMDGTDRLRGPR